MNERPDKVVTYQDNAGEWRWKRVAPNGETIADSSEGYKDMDYCVQQAVRVNGMGCAYPPPEKK